MHPGRIIYYMYMRNMYYQIKTIASSHALLGEDNR